ncbi:hypothetical protein PRZ48_012938 [Zasmidium cellare]|uniref:Uncharacterized protein n=1 Tax=Zasmidium cellare TaxID=395010 RepID=A0ABR0E309_ZASCE|nr:hypothetical protein PRZ48_012938 [Zasmidium cellare]
MFARHTQSRMKVSNVLGWKSFIDKLHPQLPLTTKESQRLLTALTSSFRKHLDEAHPPPSVEDERKSRPVDGVAKPQTRTWHSSASHADKHLASVLTNPLLAKGGKRLDYTSAKIELTKDPSKDPIQLLEEYHQQHAATVPIATFCLETVKARLDALEPEKQTELIQDLQPGRRTFLWLLQSGLDDSSSYVNDVAFTGLMVSFLVREGRENNIWEWIRIDAQLAGDVPLTTAARSRHKPMLHAYRWRGRLLRCLVQAKLGTEPGDRVKAGTIQLHEAIDTFLKACEIKDSAPPRHHLRWLPLGQAWVPLLRELRNNRFDARRDVDPDRMDRLISYMPLLYNNAGPPIFLKHETAILHLIHPRKPSVDHAFAVMQDLFGDNPSVDPEPVLARYVDPRTSNTAATFALFVARVINELQAQGRDKDASWLESSVRLRCLQLIPYLEKDLRRLARDSQPERRPQEQGYDQSRIPYAAFS